IAKEFAQYGLKAAGDDNSYFQSFDVAVGVDVKEPSRLDLGDNRAPALREDWIPLGFSASGRTEAEVVFAGYGITAKDYGYDDYAGIDAKGKIVLVLRYEPPPKNEKSPFKKFPGFSIHSALRTKANNARDHGAVGMILVDLNHSGDEKAELLSTRASLWRGGNSLLGAQLKRRVAEQWLADRDVSLQALKESIDREEKPSSMPLAGAKVVLQVTLEENRRSTDNVVAVLPGSDPNSKDEYVVIGAHYDHLGFGEFGALTAQAQGRIHHGADDNASGTAVLLDLARRLSQLQLKPARSIVFVAFSAEELGLYGSRHFVERWPAIASTKAMVNLDMVGRLRDNRLTVFGARSGKDLSAIVGAGARQLGLDIHESDGVGRSDHMSFYNKKIPVLHFFTGTHPDYHRPTDTWDKLNIEGMGKVSDLVLASVLRIANARETINFVSLPARPPATEMGQRRGGAGAYLGSIPDYGVNAEGVVLTGVTEGSPAARAGLRQGDVIIELAQKKIMNIEDLTDALGSHKPGDEIAIVVRRAGQPMTVKAILSSRG
ncbi:MAG TPA: M20/M25/M40 family metallo-hydrolase, partial [Candidatus Deferrimicrobium sp.]|nr:M20/M25/M40 family metallo-hydrolase [Candidatus Deferrimicrobium sp.]